MSVPGPGGDSSFESAGDITDITSDKSLLLGLTGDPVTETVAGREGRLFGGSGASGAAHGSSESTDFINQEGNKAASLPSTEPQYGKRKLSKEDSIILNGTGTTDESVNSTEPSDMDSSAKDESDFSSNEDSTVLVGNSVSVNAEELPSTVSVLRTGGGARVYLIGTAHFSKESQDDVSKVIQKVQPHIVMVELCSQRVNILHLDENTILEEAKNLDFEKIKGIIEQNGLFNSLIYILLLNMSAHITKQLGIAPGGEFRRAIQEAKKIPHCFVQLGDRPIRITMQRALSALSWWQTLKLVWRLLTANDPISNEDIEQCKQRELLSEMLSEMETEFPALKKVFLEERDIFLTHSLQKAAGTKHPSGATCVVGVVGIGHVQGILDNWGKVHVKAIPPIMKIPPASMSSRIVKASFKVAFVGLVVYAGFKIVPKRWFA